MVTTDDRETGLPGVSVCALLGANLIPFLLTADGSWAIGEVLALYWLESVVIGFFNIFRIVLAEGVSGTDPLGTNRTGAGGMAAGGKVVMAFFFMLHYGAFMAGHCFFLFAGLLNGFRNGDFHPLPLLMTVRWAAVALFISHGISFYFNYLKGGERFRMSPGQCMGQPYSRIVVMQLTIIGGAFLVLNMHSVVVSVLPFFIGLKTLADFWAHRRERLRFGAPAGEEKAA